MKIRISLLVTALLLIPAGALADDRVYGSGHVNFEKVYGDVKGHRIFTVNARRDGFGSVHGHAYDQYKVKEPSTGGSEITIYDHLRVDCMFIVDFGSRREAYMSAIIVKEKIKPEDRPLIGERVAFSVVDNDPQRGRRSKIPDMVSFSWVRPVGNPLTCYSDDPRVHRRDPITSGDIKIRLATEPD